MDDGTEIRIGMKQAVDGTVATSVAAYTVPAGRILRLKQLAVTTRHIDLYAGRGYLVYNGIPVMTFDISQTEIGGTTVTITADEIYSDVTVIENTDMVITSTQKISSRYISGKESMWVTKELSYNESGILVLIRNLNVTKIPPAFIPSGLL